MRISVITSSSLRRLPEFMAEVKYHAPGSVFDFFFLRETDIKSISAGLPHPPHADPKPRPAPPKTAFDLWRRPQDLQLKRVTQDWCLSHFAWMKAQGLSIGAFASYFPGISSMDKGAFDTAVHGLTDAVVLALTANERGVMDIPVVEAVCGIVSERCQCIQCVGGRHVAVFSDEAKQERLVEGLRAVVRTVNRLLRRKKTTNRRFLIGLELEPGNGYVLRDGKTLDQILSRIGADPDLAPHVGLNLDIGHMRLAGVSAGHLSDHLGSIVHAHISDHPRMHTRDHYIGAWTDVAHTNEFDDYIRLLHKRAGAPSPSPGPGALEFSGAIAIELEGCNRLEWVLRSIQELRRLLARNEVEVAPLRADAGK